MDSDGQWMTSRWGWRSYHVRGERYHSLFFLFSFDSADARIEYKIYVFSMFIYMRVYIKGAWNAWFNYTPSFARTKSDKSGFSKVAHCDYLGSRTNSLKWSPTLHVRLIVMNSYSSLSCTAALHPEARGSESYCHRPIYSHGRPRLAPTLFLNSNTL